MVTFGAGDPLAPSWLGVNSTTVWLAELATHKSPEESNADAWGEFTLEGELSVAAGVTSPLALGRVRRNRARVAIRNVDR